MTKEMVDRNLFPPTPPGLEKGAFDAKSVMNYALPSNFFYKGADSPCFAPEIKGLSALDKLAMYHMFPFPE